MADLLNQEEIDALLNSSGGGDSGDDDSADSDSEGGEPERQAGGRPKKFFHRENKNQRFRFRYFSPVVKQSRFVLNPVPGAPTPSDRPVVRTLDNYLQHQKQQRLATSR